MNDFTLPLVALLIAGSASCSSKEPAAQESAQPDVAQPKAAQDTFAPEARALTDAFMKELQGALQAAMADGGPVNAIAVCSEKAPQITAASATDGLTLRRVGVRVRNKKTNVPTEGERKILDKLETAPEYVGEVDGKTTYMRAIRMANPVCLKCHGSRKAMSPEVVAALGERYPEDEAVDFAEGDLRGAFVVQKAVMP